MTKKLVWKVRVVWNAGADEWFVIAPNSITARKMGLDLSNAIIESDEYELRYIEMTVHVEIDA